MNVMRLVLELLLCLRLWDQIYSEFGWDEICMCLKGCSTNDKDVF